MTFTVLLGQGNADQLVRRQFELSDVKAPADAVPRGLLIAKPMTHAEPEELRDAVTFSLGARATFFEVAESRSFAVDEAVKPQPVARDWNGDRRAVGQVMLRWLRKRHRGMVPEGDDAYQYW